MDDDRRRRSRLASWLLGAVAVALIVLGITGRRPGPSGVQPSSTSSPFTLSPLPPGAARSASTAPAPLENAGCSFVDRGFGDYAAWRPLPLGRLLVSSSAVTTDGSFPLLVHFHGAEPVRKELAPERTGLVIYALDAGVGTAAYAKPFESQEAFASLIESIEREVANVRGLARAHATRVILSAWSAGSGAVNAIVDKHADRINAVVLLDSLYANYADGARTPARDRIDRWAGIAKRAMGDGPLLVLTYSGIPTPDYASTAEVAASLLGAIGRAQKAIADAPSPDWSAPTSTFDEGGLSIRGYGGTTKEAHCAHLRKLLPTLRDVVLPKLAR